MDITTQLQQEKVVIDRALAAFLRDVEKETRDKDPFVADAVAYLTTTMLAGGKRLRPIMVCWGYRATGGTNEKAIVTASLSMELIHAFLLMHDDIIDRDVMRHGMPTMHAHYTDYFREYFGDADAEHFGQAMGIVMGDFAYSIGNRALFAADFSSDVVVRALQNLQEIVGLTVVGEMQDVRMGYAKKATRADILRMYENKTARYTFEGPLRLGATLAGACDAAQVPWARYAVPIGMAFQIRDDMLGIFGEEEKTGKSVGSDLAEGKMTLLVREALDGATRAQRATITTLLGKGDVITADDLAQFREMMVVTGARERVNAIMMSLTEEARSALHAFSITNDAKAFLDGIAAYVGARDV